MFHDVFACFEEVEPLSAHEVHCLGQAALDEVISLGVVVDPLGTFDVQLRQAVENHIPCIEIYAPSQPLLDLRLSSLMKHLARASLPIVLLDLTVPAAPHSVWIFVFALDLPHAVGTVALPAIQQRILAKFFALDYLLRQAHAILLALNWHFLALQPLVDHGCPLLRGGHVAIDLFILAEGGGDDGPLDCIGLEMQLVLHQSIQIALLHLVKPAEEILFVQHSNHLLVEYREIPKSFGGVCAEDLVPGYQPSEILLKLHWGGVEIALAVGPEMLDGNIFAEAYILQLMGL